MLISSFQERVVFGSNSLVGCPLGEIRGCVRSVHGGRVVDIKPICE